jgi:hypothetical protein
MSQARTIKVKLTGDKDLGFCLQAPKRGAVNDAISIDLKRRPKIVGFPRAERLEIE